MSRKKKQNLFSKNDYLQVRKNKKLSVRELEFYKYLRSAHRKMEITERKDAKYLRKQGFKEKRRKTRKMWRINEAIEAIIGLIQNPIQKQYFVNLYEKKLSKKRHYNAFERFLLSSLKQQRKIRRKRYTIISSYKWQKLDSPRKLQRFWNFFYNRKIKSTANTTFVKWHSQKLYTLKRAFRFFYGYLKNSVWKKAFAKSKRKPNKLLHFLSYLENRLCICLFRMNFVLSMRQAKQFIRHGFVYVNGRVIRYSNYLLKKNDIISVNWNAIIKYVWTKNGELDYSILIARPPRQMLHLHVNHRISTGIFLYDPKIAFQLRTPHIPNFFFGKDEIKFEYVDFYKDTKNEKAFNNYVKRKAAEKEKKIRNANPILDTYNSKLINDRDKVPLKNVRLILSFFMKK